MLSDKLTIDSENNSNRKGLFDNVQYGLLLLYVVFVYLFNGNITYNKLIYVPLIPFIIMEFCYIIKTKKIKTTKYLIALFLFNVICLLTCIWSVDRALAMSRTYTLFLLTTALVFIYNYCKRTKKSVLDILRLLLFAGVTLSVYVIFYYGMELLLSIFSDNIRIASDINNVNALGTELAITAVIMIYFGMNNKKSYYYLLSIIPITLSLGTASKNAFIYLILGITMLIVLKHNCEPTLFRFVKKLLLVVVFILITLLIVQTGVFPMLSKRLNDFSSKFTGSGKADVSTTERDIFLKYGINAFYENPIGGIGVGNSNTITMAAAGWETYLHNNYIELLATTGLLGTLVYYYVFISLIVFSIVNYKNKHSPVVIIMLLLWLIMDWGSVSYYDKVTYLLILIGILHYSNTVKKDKNVYEIN